MENKEKLIKPCLCGGTYYPVGAEYRKGLVAHVTYRTECNECGNNEFISLPRANLPKEYQNGSVS